MFRWTKRNTAILTIVIVFVLDVMLSSTLYGWQKLYAAGPSKDIISIFVDSNIAGAIGDNLNWFTNQYVGRNEKNAKIMLFQIDNNGITPADMVKINQNLYLEGDKTGPSRLIGTIMIGDLRLPMVNKQGFLFPTVYPLVDFDKPKYYYNPDSDYFEYVSEGNGQPEIWHSIINFGANGTEYNVYFDKLRKYAEDPESWVDKGLWYEDILHQKQTINRDNFQKYINNFVFGEDVMYNRYTNLMVDIFQALHNSGVVEVLSGYDGQVTTSLGDEYYNDAEFSEIKGNYSKEIEKFWSVIKALKKLVGENNNGNSGADPEPSESALGTLPNSKFINTIFIQKVVEGFMKDYIELYGTSYFDTKENRLSLGGRYLENSKLGATSSEISPGAPNQELGTKNGFVDDHISMVSRWDEVSKQLMVDANTKFEKALDERIVQQGYAMNVVVPTRIEDPKDGGLLGGIAGGLVGGVAGLALGAAGLFKKIKTYEVYYFGLPAEQLQTAEDFGIYRGTFNNIRSIPKLNNFNYTDRMGFDAQQSVGATRGENAREVEAQRGYDFSLIEYDQQEFERVKNLMPYKKHKKKRKNISAFIKYYRAGYTPLNIDPDSDDIRLNIGKMDYTQLWNPFLDRSIGGWVYNIAGSRITTEDRKIGFTLGSEDEDDDGSDDDDENIVTNAKSYSGYSDSFLGKDFFGSAIQVTRDDGKWIKVHKKKVRNNGKPRKTDRDQINLRSLGSNSTNDGIYLLPNGRAYTDESDYIQIQQGDDSKRKRYVKSVDSRYFHKSPTIEDLYGEYIPRLENFEKTYLLCDTEAPTEEDDNAPPATCEGYQFKFTDLYPGDVQTILYAKKSDHYFVTGGKVYFNASAVRYEHGTVVSLDGAIGEITGGNKLYLRYDDRDIYLPWGESTFDCEDLNVDVDTLTTCEGVKFTVNDRMMDPVPEKYVNITHSGTRVEFLDGATVTVQGKAVSLAGLVANLDTSSQVATFSGKQLQIGGINEFTLERPIDAPRYLNFQGIGGNKLTRVYPNVWKVPVFEDIEGKRVLKTVDKIRESLRSYLVGKAKEYNDDLTREYANRFNYYYGNEGGVPRSTWIDKMDDYDRTISPLVQADNTGLQLRPYQFLPDDYFVQLLATTWNDKPVSSEDMLTIVAEQLHYQNSMRQALPQAVDTKVLNEVSLYQSFADLNHKSTNVLHTYLVDEQEGAIVSSKDVRTLQFPYYNLSGYEVGYINSDGSDYIQFETTPPLIRLIQKQKAQQVAPGTKTREQLDLGRCGDKIPPSYTVSLGKRPQAFKCRLEEITNHPFELKISFVGSANGVDFGGGSFGDIVGGIGSIGENIGEETITQARQGWTGYAQGWRNLLREEDEGIGVDESRQLHKKLDNLILSYSTKLPSVQSGVTITIEQKQNLGSYSFQLITSGANCFLVNGPGGQDLCKTPQIIQIEPGKTLSYTYTFGNPKGIGDMLVQAKVCSTKCINKNTVIATQAGEIASFKFVSPLGGQILPIARGNMLPLLIRGYDSFGNQVGSTIHNFVVSSEHKGGLLYDNQLGESFEISSFLNAGFLYDSFTTAGTKETIRIKSATNLIPVNQEISLDIVDPTIAVTPETIHFTLPEDSKDLEKQQGSIGFVDLTKLPKLNIIINNQQPIYSVVNAKSLGAKFIVGVKRIKKQVTPAGTVDITTFEPLDQIIHTGGALELYLYPTMKAGQDIIQLQVGNALQSVAVNVLPAKPKKTVLKLDKLVTDLEGEIKGVLSVTDIWGNLITSDSKVLMGIFGNIDIDGVSGSGSTLTIQGEKELTIRPKFPGGQAYLFTTLVGVPFEQQYPDYQTILVQNRSRPTAHLNIAYLNLYGSNWSDQVDSQTQKIIGSSILTDSDKTLAVTTQKVDLSQVYKSVFGMKADGKFITFDGTVVSGYEQSEIQGVNGYTTPYGWLPVGKSLQELAEDWKLAVDNSKYKVVLMDVGQSNNQALIIQELALSLGEFDKSVPSIQHSSNNNYNIGFGDNFKPITNFAHGQSVGQATTPYASEYVINLGDPSYRIGETNKLIDQTNYDGGIGDVVYADPDRIIVQTMDIDWDRAGDKDLLVVYSDGRIRLLIAQGNRQYQKVGDLAYIADGIKKVYVGDGDGDGYQDVFVHTLANQLRFYKNYDGKRIEVDGYPICLNLDEDSAQSDPTNLDSVYQRFLTDPNKDKVTDIVVNDKNNNIRLFLGGGTNTLFELGFGGGNYISRDKLGCDPGWKERQEGKSTVVKSFAPQINDIQIRDESLVHWNGLNPIDTAGTINPNAPTMEEIEGPDKVQFDLSIDKDKKPKELIQDVKNQIFSTFNPKAWIEEYKQTLDNTITLDSTYRPIFEQGTGEIVYKQLESLIESDKMDGYKKFIDLNGGRLEDGDVVKVEITLNPRGASKASYIEKLSGPWEVPVSGGRQVGFFAGNLNADHVFILAPGPSYVFMIDNITLGSSVTFGYHVVFRSQQIVTIAHGEDHIATNGLGGSIGKLLSSEAVAQDQNLPAWLEITPLDGCAKFKRKILVENAGPILSSWFREIKIDIQKVIANNQSENEELFSEGLNTTFTDLVDDTVSGISEEVRNAYLRETWRQKGVLKDDPALQEIEQLANSLEALGNLNIGVNAKIGGFGSDIDSVLNSKIGSLTKGLCEGFKVGQKSCSGIPILSSLPWNMAFLSPGDMQIMGCKIFKDKGLPLLWFPATLQTPVGPIPFLGPIGQKGPGDGFYRVGGGTYASLVRVYFSPTLTAKLGIGICFGPYGVGINFPKPFKDIAGNCIVFAVDPGIGKCEVEKSEEQETGRYVISPEVKQLDNTNVCNDDITVKNSPLKLVETVVNSTDNRLESVQGQYGMVIKLGGYANLTNYDSISLSNFFSKVRLEGGNPIDLKIKSSLDRGIVSCIMNQFVDNQIRYMINNLTTLNLNVVLPDIQGLGNQVELVGDVFTKSGREELKQSDEYKDLEQDSAKILESNQASLSAMVKGKQSKQELTKRLDTVLSNPFDKLAVFFNDSELIRVSTRDVLVEIPWVYTEDVGKLKGIYTAWLARNKPIWKERDLAYQDLIKKCDEMTDQFEKEKCQNSANQILQVNNRLGQFERSARQNIETIELYGQLPKQVYELLHGYDRYIYDVFNFAYGTIDAVTSWLSKIARGFDARVTFIISLINIIKSRQILIDFSVNWKETCSKCTVDNYSSYSCSFSFLCPKLPVFNIPPFKIPSITIDLSNLDLSTDIILPRFRFQPKRVGVFDNLMQFGIPDTPFPPSMGSFNGNLDVSLPRLPVIPRPPDLSAISLPSFIPQITFRGPTLPPAPRIPKIAPELGLAIDIADFIGRIYCIIKGGIGLVGEAGLKSKIEQITQRTRQVEPFDSLKVLIPKPPLQTVNLFKPGKVQGGSFDVKLEAFADVRMYFDGIYALFDGIANVINDGTSRVLRDSDQIPGVEKVDSRLKNKYYEGDAFLEQYDGATVNVTPFGKADTRLYGGLTMDDFELDKMNTATSDYHTINTKIQADLEYFVSKDKQDNSDKRKLLAGEVIRSYSLPTATSINFTGLESVRSQAAQIMQQELDGNADIKEWVIQDYDGWLRHIANTQYVSSDHYELSLGTKLLDLDQETLAYLKEYNIAEEYVDTQKTIVDGYVHALQVSDYSSLGMKKSDYDQSKYYLEDLQRNITLASHTLKDSENVEGTEKTTCALCNSTGGIDNRIVGNVLLSQGGGGGGAGGGGSIAGISADDPARHIKGYFVQGSDGDYHNVISNMDKGEELSQVAFEKDLDGDKLREIVSWDQHTVYIKYAKKAEAYADGQVGNAEVVTYTFETVQDIENETDTFGFAEEMKIWSNHFMPKEWRVAGQAYQSMTYSLSSELEPEEGAPGDEALIGYIVRYTDDINGAISKNATYKYLLLLDSVRQGQTIHTISIDGKSLDVDEIMIQYLQADQDEISVVLSNLPRRRYFTQIAKLRSEEYTNPLLRFIPFIAKRVTTTIFKSSPWSLHETAGMQVVADTSSPYANVTLKREKKNELVAQGDVMYGTIKTYYKLEGERFDDSKVVKSWILDENDKVLFSGETDKILVEDIYAGKPTSLVYKLVGEDAAGNVGQKTITVQLLLPKLTLDDVQTNAIGQSDAISHLDTDIDQGAVQFVRVRNGVESVLQSLLGKKSLFETTTSQVTVTGGKFAFKQDIGFYDADGTYLNISITPEGQIINNNSQIDIKVDFIDNVPKILLMKDNLELYRIYLKAKSLDLQSDITVLNGNYQLFDLPNEGVQLGQFANGKCIKPKNGICEIMISPNGYIYISKPYHRVYGATYGFQNGKVVYTLQKGTTTVAEIKVQTEEVK